MGKRGGAGGRGIKRLILDTNVVARFLLGEPSEQAKAVAELFARSDRREIELVLEPLVAAESIFVLTSFYKKTARRWWRQRCRWW